jgi:hypothetical protein
MIRVLGRFIGAKCVHRAPGRSRGFTFFPGWAGRVAEAGTLLAEGNEASRMRAGLQFRKTEVTCSVGR